MDHVLQGLNQDNSQNKLTKINQFFFISIVENEFLNNRIRRSREIILINFHLIT